MEIVYGIIAGIITSLGMGGGTILILLLNLFSDIDGEIIQSINYLFYIPTAIIICVINKKRKLIDLKKSKDIILSGIIGSIIGVVLNFKFDNKKVKKWFGIFIIIMGVYEVYRLFLQYKNNKKNI